MSHLTQVDMKNAIQNPILRGFNPDPSICRVGDDYYVATSTFEWFPGVQIHHSRDLRHFRLLTRPLDSVSLLDLRGNPNSGGIWAPCLSHDGELFHLIYTDVKSWGDGFNDSHNYLVTAKDIEGPWSEPVRLNSSGFDASMFHDQDGTKWLLNMEWDFRPERHAFNGILMQQYDPDARRLVGPVHNIFKGTGKGLTEGPHLYQMRGEYYLMVAEGGTVYEHCVAMARAKDRLGPYVADPQVHLLSSEAEPDALLQKAGHASLVETKGGELFLAHLTGRPFDERRRCTLGRETALQALVFDAEGWLRLRQGGKTPAAALEGPDLPEHAFPVAPGRRDFEADAELPLEFQTLRVPADESWLSLKERPGHLRLVGRESPASLHRQSLVARRVQSHHIAAQTKVDFRPTGFQQFAGLVAWYDTRHHYSLCVGHDEEQGRCLRILAMDKGTMSQPCPVIACPDSESVELRLEMHEAKLRFAYRLDGGSFIDCGVELDASILSDDYVDLGFTGAFVGMAAYDLSGSKLSADFDYFDYQEL